MKARTLLLVVLLLLPGVAGLVLGLEGDRSRLVAAYLCGFLAVAVVPVGALFVLLIGNATNARWFVAVRRVTEDLAAAMPILVLLFLPILFWLPDLYPWARDPASLPPQIREHLAHKGAWLNPSGFMLRSLIYFAVLITFAELLRRASLLQTKAPIRWTLRLRAISFVALWPLALVVTFAGFDWVMSLDATFGSTILGIYLFAESVLTAVALVALIVCTADLRVDSRPAISPSHRHALGQLMLTFLIFWTYIAYSQFFIVYMGDLPEEVPFYLRRLDPPHLWVTLALLVLRFVVPFLLLLSRELKRRPRPLAAVAAWLVLGAWIDALHLVAPSVHPESGPGWAHLLTYLAMAALLGVFCTFRARRRPALAIDDPDFELSLRYQSG
jgi:hypothetical protein